MSDMRRKQQDAFGEQKKIRNREDAQALLEQAQSPMQNIAMGIKTLGVCLNSLEAYDDPTAQQTVLKALNLNEKNLLDLLQKQIEKIPLDQSGLAQYKQLQTHLADIEKIQRKRGEFTQKFDSLKAQMKKELDPVFKPLEEKQASVARAQREEGQKKESGKDVVIWNYAKINKQIKILQGICNDLKKDLNQTKEAKNKRNKPRLEQIMGTIRMVENALKERNVEDAQTLLITLQSLTVGESKIARLFSQPFTKEINKHIHSARLSAAISSVTPSSADVREFRTSPEFKKLEASLESQAAPSTPRKR